MALTNSIAMTSLSVEIGQNSDWKGASLVSQAGLITHDCGELAVMRAGPAQFELWHPTGLKLKVDFNEQLETCADLLAEELEHRDTSSSEVACDG